MKKRFVLPALAMVGVGIYGARRSILARLLKLPPPRNGVGVERNIPVPMPDGVHLLTDHYYPKASGDYPTILIRTPYGRGREGSLGTGYPLAELPAQRFAERGYHVVVQGARGCLDSEGTFSPHIHEAPDGEATVAWIVQQPWFNGLLGTWGPSYLGYTQWATASSAPASLKAMVPMITSAENFTTTHPEGAFGLETRLRWSQSMHLQNRTHPLPLADVLRERIAGDTEQRLQAAFNHLPLVDADIAATGEPVPIYRAILTHDQTGDPFWTARDHSGSVAGVRAAVHLIGGWYDYYLRGLLRDYAVLRDAGREPHLTVGPWYHAQAEGMLTGLRAGVTWFDAHLRGDSGRLRPEPVRLYVMGAEEWRTFDAYPPPARERRYYLQAGARLSPDPPPTGSPADHYRYDPADPTPTVGGALLAMQGAGPQDNRALEARPDVLCYTTHPLDRAIEVIGPVRLELYVHSSLAHTDFAGRLCDVAPDGRSTNLCDGLVRVKPGRGGAQPDGSLRLEIDLWATAHRFQRGHRLRLQVSSGSHPRWSRNLGTGEPLTTGVRMAVAEQTIYHDEAHPSALVLPVVSG